MAPVRVSPALPLALLALLAACGGDGGSGAAPAAADHLMLADGNRWAYDYTLSSLGPTPAAVTLVTATAATLSGGESVMQLEERSLGNASFGFSSSLLLRQDASRLASVVDLAPGDTLPFPNPLPLLQLPLRQGEAYDLYDYVADPSYVDHDGDYVTEPVTVRARVTEVAAETVTVPAGVFDTLRVVRERQDSWVNSSDGSPGGAVFIEREWYARGVGPVRRERETGHLREQWALTRYRVGGRASDTTPPQVVATYPAPAATEAAGNVLGLRLVFSETVDPLTVHLQLVDAAQVAVSPLHVYYAPAMNEVDIQLVPALAAGTYTATLEQARDLMGNPVAAPYSWTFTLE